LPFGLVVGGAAMKGWRGIRGSDFAAIISSWGWFIGELGKFTGLIGWSRTVLDIDFSSGLSCLAHFFQSFSFYLLLTTYYFAYADLKISHVNQCLPLYYQHPNQKSLSAYC